ncbi:hypothetical protein AMTRI_Chr06g191760 [Amborella trichopoda]
MLERLRLFKRTSGTSWLRGIQPQLGGLSWMMASPVLSMFIPGNIRPSLTPLNLLQPGIVKSQCNSRHLGMGRKRKTEFIDSLTMPEFLNGLTMPEFLNGLTMPRKIAPRS